MKRSYETAQMEIFMFAVKDVIVASGVEDVFTPSYTPEDNEMEML